MHMMPWGPGGGSFFWIGTLFMLLFWALVILGIVALVTWIGRQGRGAGTVAGETPLDALKKRYARGELTKEEYESIKKDLEG